MADRRAYQAAYYEANRDRMRKNRRLHQKTYRRRHAAAIKVAHCLGVPIGRARALLGERS